MGRLSDDRPLPQAPSPAQPNNGSSSFSPQAATTSPFQRNYADEPLQEPDTDELPPLYTEQDPLVDVVGDQEPPPRLIEPLMPSNLPRLQVQPFSKDRKTGISYFLDRRLESDPIFLEQQIGILAHQPPRPIVRLRGTHRERRRHGCSSDHPHRGHKKHKSHTVTDFDVQLELTHLLYQGSVARSVRPWRTVHTAGNFDKVRRGGVCASRAPGYGGSSDADLAEHGTPELADWCERFVYSRAGLRAFTLRRRIEGWDWALVQHRLETLVRETNYRGKLSVEFPVYNERTEIYNNCLTNRWRLTQWIQVVFTFTLLFLFVWPYLFFRTKRWETVFVTWEMSRVGPDGERRYVSMSEDRWFNTWARAVRNAILERRQGTLDARSLNETVNCDIENIGAVDRTFGWGEDSC